MFSQFGKLLAWFLETAESPNSVKIRLCSSLWTPFPISCFWKSWQWTSTQVFEISNRNNMTSDVWWETAFVWSCSVIHYFCYFHCLLSRYFNTNLFIFLMEGRFPRTQLTNISQLLLYLCSWWNVHQAYNRLYNWTFSTLLVLYWTMWATFFKNTETISQIFHRKPENAWMGRYNKDHRDSCGKGKENHCASLKELGSCMLIYCKIKMILPRYMEGIWERNSFSWNLLGFFSFI